ncbi:MAG: hypothetical protein ACI8UR_000422 [Natronomonas sp.]|jgi:hypothetical protein|uniref:PLDc N-terminal domain-containing protein n=1 Tax=Natronomonas sp. TaxID=2184060 RepID=UPI0039898F6C
MGALHTIVTASSIPIVPAQAGGAFLLGLLLFVIFAIVLPYWVYTDAKSKGSDNALLWAIIVFLAPLLGLVLYLLLGDDY